MVGGCGGGVEQWWFCWVERCQVWVFLDRVVGFCALGGRGWGGSMGVPVYGVHFGFLGAQSGSCVFKSRLIIQGIV